MNLNSDKSAISSLDIPETLGLLQNIRPDMLLLRIVAKSLVFWEEVDATNDWVESQIPNIIHDLYAYLEESSNIASLSGIVAMDFDLDNTGVGKNIDQKNKAFKVDRNIFDNDVDKQAIRQIYAYLVAGACFTLGLRFAGTGNSNAASIVLKKLEFFQEMRDGSNSHAIARRPERPLLEMCVSCTSVSLAMIMAGTGDLDALRILRELYCKYESEVRDMIIS